jgi:NitT/TauT family transport system substrate-binding protein
MIFSHHAVIFRRERRFSGVLAGILVIFLVFGLLSLTSLGWAQNQPTPKLDPPVKLRLGVLPIFDTILLHLAVQQKYFSQRGLEVELIPFQSMLEKDAAVLAGLLDGHFCEISSAMVQRSQGNLYKIVAITSHTEPNQRVFGLVTKPGSKAQNLADLKDQTIGIARQTIVDYLTDVFLIKANQRLDYFQRRDIRKIPIRQQMLQAGQLETALFPEPLLSMAEKNGGRVILDDRNLDMPLAAIALRDEFSTPQVVKAFREALAQAVAYANTNPIPTRDLMMERGLISNNLADWTPPTYNPEHVPTALPDKGLFDSYVDWLVRGEVLKRAGSMGNIRQAPTFEDTIYQSDFNP